MVTHDINYRIVMIHQATKLHEISPWEYIEFMLTSSVVLTYRWDPKVVIYSLYIGLLLMKVSDNKYF